MQQARTKTRRCVHTPCYYCCPHTHPATTAVHRAVYPPYPCLTYIAPHTPLPLPLPDLSVWAACSGRLIRPEVPGLWSGHAVPRRQVQPDLEGWHGMGGRQAVGQARVGQGQCCWRPVVDRQAWAGSFTTLTLFTRQLMTIGGSWWLEWLSCHVGGRQGSQVQADVEAEVRRQAGRPFREEENREGPGCLSDIVPPTPVLSCQLCMQPPSPLPARHPSSLPNAIRPACPPASAIFTGNYGSNSCHGQLDGPKFYRKSRGGQHKTR